MREKPAICELFGAPHVGGITRCAAEITASAAGWRASGGVPRDRLGGRRRRAAAQAAQRRAEVRADHAGEREAAAGGDQGVAVVAGHADDAASA